MLKLVLHDWDDARAARILGNIRNAIIPGGRLIIIEAVMPPGDDYHHAKFLDVNMLVLSEGGRERTEEEYRTLLDGHSKADGIDHISRRWLRLPRLELSRLVRFTNRFTEQGIDLRFCTRPASWRTASGRNRHVRAHKATA